MKGRRGSGPSPKAGEFFKDSAAADERLFSYFKYFMDDKGVASVTPSSKYLAGRVIKAMDLRGPSPVVVEYGAADGTMTRRILERLPAGASLLSVELNQSLFGALKRLCDPRLKVFQGDVRNISSIARQFGISQADVIVSGIPFAFLSGRGRHELLSSTSQLLRPGGRFVAYQVTTHLIPLLKDYFRKVKTEFEIRNIPPHFVFTAIK